MKKAIFTVLCTAILFLNAFVVFAGVNAYTDPRSLASRGSVVRTSQPQADGCVLTITASSEDTYFMNKARKECMENNKFNQKCQQRCFKQANVLLRSDSLTRAVGAYSRYGCKELDPAVLSGSSTSRCYFDASNECAQLNVGNDYCRKKCVEKSYSTCRHNTQAMKYI